MVQQLIMFDPPAQVKYNAIKTILISVFSDSIQEKFENIMNAELGDQKPSHLLAYMKRLAQQMNMNDEQLKMIYLKKLPPSARGVLSIIQSPLNEIGAMADSVVKQEAQVNQVNKSSDSKYDEIKGEIENLTAVVRRMSQEQKSRSFRYKHQSDSHDICWYHREHGKNARKCRQPYKFSKN